MPEIDTSNRPKFRIWDTKEKKYFQPTYEAYKGNLEDMTITMAGELVRRTIDMPSEHESLFPGRYIVEMYSGVIGKKKEELYLNDIVIGDSQVDNGVIGVVKFENGVFSHSKSSIGWEGETMIYLYQCTKIGNINENPELLKKGQ